tara:strand:- start:2586 stop:3929 length:1344 start_codon:yes stop_codon:yes gene_type:complete
MDINELNTKVEKEDSGSSDPKGISFQLSLDETPDLVSKNADLEVNQALSEQMIEDLTIDEIKSVIGQLNLKKHDSDKGLINVDQLASVLNDAPPELAAEVLRGIDWYHASQVISKIRDMEAVGKLYKYQKPSDEFMKHDFVAIRSAWSVSHTVSVLRKSNISSNKLQNLFVVDAKGKLVGSIDISDLIFANLTQSVFEVMKPNLISVTVDTGKKECANIMDKHGLRALAVTNKEGILEGVISIEEVVHLVEQEATKDMFNMVGMSIDDKVIGPIKNSFKRRLPWLIINLGTVLFAGFILSLFTNHVKQMPVLAVFLPVIIGQAGIAGTQTLTLVVRALALGEVTTKDTRNILNRELILSVIQGLSVTLLLFLVVYIWKSDLNLAMLVAGAMLLNLFVAGLMGVIVPIFMKTVNLDPASSSAVIVTTFTDIAGVLLYMGLASLIIFGL